ncbi:MAG: DUF4089 domain-containing protein [Novosphingobium sp.]
MSGGEGLPLTVEQVRLLAGLAGIEIAPGHMPGVIRNLEILREQAALLAEPPIEPLVEPAPVFRP